MISNQSRQGHFHYSLFIIHRSIFIKGELQRKLQLALFVMSGQQGLFHVAAEDGGAGFLVEAEGDGDFGILSQLGEVTGEEGFLQAGIVLLGGVAV